MAVHSLAEMKSYAAQAGFSGTLPAIMAAIGDAESSGRDDVVNAIGCVGIWQINQPAWKSSHPEWTVEWLKNPANNAAAAYAVYQAQGLKAWTTYTSGEYKKYLSQATAADINLGDLNPIQAGKDAAGAIRDTDSLSTLATIVTNLFDPKRWIRIAYVLAGIACILVALANMTASSKTLKTAVKIAEVVPKP